MHSPARLLIVDDSETNRDILETRLKVHGYDLVQAADGEEAIAATYRDRPDLILLDVMMPKLDGFEVCRRLKADAALPFTPIILVTAKADSKDVVAGLEAGADEYLTKPVDQAALVARVRSMLRLKALHDQVQAQAADLAVWNRTLEQRVAAQVTEIERMAKLKRFLPAQVAELVIASGDERLLENHRRDVTVVFCDLRGFTPFAETAEPEEVMTVLREYHTALGPLIQHHEGTLERFTGDGLMVIFNDPVERPDHTERAARMAVAMQAAVAELNVVWRRRGHDLGFGVGVARGFATLGRIGFEGRSDYAAIGTVSNLAARLCGEAKAGQILVSQRVAASVEAVADAASVGDMSLKGFARPTPVYELRGLR